MGGVVRGPRILGWDLRGRRGSLETRGGVGGLVVVCRWALLVDFWGALEGLGGLVVGAMLVWW